MTQLWLPMRSVRALGELGELAELVEAYMTTVLEAEVLPEGRMRNLQVEVVDPVTDTHLGGGCCVVR